LKAGIRLKTTDDLFAGQAISADFTGQGWREKLKIPDTPMLSLGQAGEHLAQLARNYDFSFFEYWISDYAGHKAVMDQSIQLIENFDAMLGGLISVWDPTQGVILITSDHGNLEDNLTRKHTFNLVPGLMIGAQNLMDSLRQSLSDLTDITPAILRFFE
jgi:bisphosphoglycerate-independent phosphoglycerate mutase (AlkP superfamily)